MSIKNTKIRIGCASAFYGDSQLAARQLVDGGELDYLVFDYLAETTMAILARARQRNDHLGFATDFVSVVLRDVLKDCVEKNIRIVANAGGVNVPACIAAIESLCKEQQLSVKVAGVYGDSLITQASKLEFESIDKATVSDLPEKRIASMNAYFGAQPIVEALDAGAHIVVTGRVVDSAVVLAPLMHEFSWNISDYDLLAQGSLAGHILECGAQCTGGNFTDWHLVPDFSNMSYPIAEVDADGSFDITIVEGTGGLVNRATIAEQIVYEIGDPSNYLLPDVHCDFSQVRLVNIGTNRVKVSGAKGRAPGPFYKVCTTFVDGYRLLGSFFMAGPDVATKIKTNLNAWINRTREEFRKREIDDYRAVELQVIGAESIYGENAQTGHPREAMGQYGLHHDNRDALQFAAAELAYLATSAAPGMTGFGASRSKPQPLIRVHSSLIDRANVPVRVQMGDSVIRTAAYESPARSEPAALSRFSVSSPGIKPDYESIELGKLVYTRSGDKGADANIGVIARHPDFVPYLLEQLTEDVVADYFSHLVHGTVTRYELPGFNAMNFVLTDALDGGSTASLRVDSQGKTYGQMLLSLELKLPKDLVHQAANNWL